MDRWGLRNGQRIITRAKPLYHSLVLQSLRCHRGLYKASAVMVDKMSQCRRINVLFASVYTAVSAKVVPLKCKSVRDDADWYYG